MTRSYADTLTHLFALLPMYQRVGAAAYRADLTNTIALCAAIDNPYTHYKTVHVGGTNGKGSVAHLTAAALQAAGYKTGLYTSPHLLDFRERIRINGQMIPEADVVAFVDRIEPIIQKTNPSFFEVTVAMAFDYFAQNEVDVAVIEVGMGGRLDSTNVITPELSIITNIGYDHQQFLGSTLAAIAGEKAGIIKPKIPVLIGERHYETKSVFFQKSNKLHAPLQYASDLYRCTARHYTLGDDGPTATFDVLDVATGLTTTHASQLTGNYQRHNIPTFLAAMKLLRGRGFMLNDADIAQALTQVCNTTGLKGRWQMLQRQPLVMAECAHNREGLLEAMAQVRETPHAKLHMVLGVVNDKDLSSILPLLPPQATYYFCKPDIPRGLDADQLAAAAAAKHGLLGSTYINVETALKAALAQAEANDLIYVGGSMFVVAEALGVFTNDGWK